MKKTCGYLDQKGGFHKTLIEANDANIRHEVSRIRDRIINLVTSYSMRHASKIEDIARRPDFSSPSEVLEKVISELIYYKRTQLVELSLQIEKLEKKEEFLEAKLRCPKLLRKDWWLKTPFTYEF